jgi:hypothetical protein
LAIIVAIGGVVAFLVLLLSVPVSMAFDIEKDTDLRKSVRLRWLFGLVHKELGSPKRPARSKPKSEARPKRRRGRNGFRVFRRVVTTKGLVKRILVFLKRLVKGVQIRRLQAYVRIGLDDPADTGQLLGIIWPALAFAPSSPSINITIEPDFQEATLQGYGRGLIRVFPIQLMWIVLRFLVSITTIRAATAAIKAGRR